LWGLQAGQLRRWPRLASRPAGGAERQNRGAPRLCRTGGLV